MYNHKNIQEECIENDEDLNPIEIIHESIYDIIIRSKYHPINNNIKYINLPIIGKTSCWEPLGDRINIKEKMNSISANYSEYILIKIICPVNLETILSELDNKFDKLFIDKLFDELVEFATKIFDRIQWVFKIKQSIYIGIQKIEILQKLAVDVDIKLINKINNHKNQNNHIYGGRIDKFTSLASGQISSKFLEKILLSNPELIGNNELEQIYFVAFGEIYNSDDYIKFTDIDNNIDNNIDKIEKCVQIYQKENIKINDYKRKIYVKYLKNIKFVKKYKIPIDWIKPDEYISVRSDGKNFSTVIPILKRLGIFEQGYSIKFENIMVEIANKLFDCELINQYGYIEWIFTQSDEITCLIKICKQVDKAYFNTLISSLISSMFLHKVIKLIEITNKSQILDLIAKLPTIMFDCRTGRYSNLKESFELILWRSWDCSVNGLSQAVQNSGIEGAKKLKLNSAEKILWLNSNNLLPLRDHQAYGTLLNHLAKHIIGPVVTNVKDCIIKLV